MRKQGHTDCTNKARVDQNALWRKKGLTNRWCFRSGTCSLEKQDTWESKLGPDRRQEKMRAIVEATQGGEAVSHQPGNERRTEGSGGKPVGGGYAAATWSGQMLRPQRHCGGGEMWQTVRWHNNGWHPASTSASFPPAGGMCTVNVAGLLAAVTHRGEHKRPNCSSGKAFTWQVATASCLWEAATMFEVKLSRNHWGKPKPHCAAPEQETSRWEVHGAGDIARGSWSTEEERSHLSSESLAQTLGAETETNSSAEPTEVTARKTLSKKMAVLSS